MNFPKWNDFLAKGKNLASLSSILIYWLVPFLDLLELYTFEVVCQEEQRDSLAEVEVSSCAGVHDLCYRIVITFVEGYPVVPV